MAKTILSQRKHEQPAVIFDQSHLFLVMPSWWIFIVFVCIITYGLVVRNFLLSIIIGILMAIFYLMTWTTRKQDHKLMREYKENSRFSDGLIIDRWIEEFDGKMLFYVVYQYTDYKGVIRRAWLCLNNMGYDTNRVYNKLPIGGEARVWYDMRDFKKSCLDKRYLDYLAK
jgi:MFS superfamily sulfate permease-like transporter